MSLPRDISGREFAVLLRRHYGYTIARQSGSHMRLVTTDLGVHRLTVPAGGPLRVGTLAAVLSEVARHFHIDRSEVEGRLFG
ncbi:MAG: type II toxin-antitoxin system HicA family toxin [Acidimicrobiales bacterium]|nr:type II toxin-antitoxin system HicA family toxin [Acidimicrobiales bacterium]